MSVGALQTIKDLVGGRLSLASSFDVVVESLELFGIAVDKLELVKMSKEIIQDGGIGRHPKTQVNASYAGKADVDEALRLLGYTGELSQLQPASTDPFH